MKVEFWGVRGSVPAPLSSEDVSTRLKLALMHLGAESNPPDLSDAQAVKTWIDALPPSVRGHSGGNTPCVTMTTDDGDLFIIDLGTGARPLGNRLMDGPMGKGQGRANVFLSHLHWDHVQGWPFFKPAYVPGNQFQIYARHEGVEERLKQQQAAPFFPPAAWDDMRASFTYHHLTEQPLELCEGRVRVSTIELNHPSCAYAFRFEADGRVFIYASDGAYLELDDASLSPFVDFYRDADLLVFDAQFTLSESFEKRTWGHSSAVVGVELACRANVNKLALFHHDPNSDDELLNRMLRVAKEYDAGSSSQLKRTPCEVEMFLAYEGLSLTL